MGPISGPICRRSSTCSTGRRGTTGSGSAFSVHDSWVLTALVPLVALFPTAQTLIVVQVLAVAVAAVPLALLAREFGLDARSANLLAIAYLLSPAAQGLTYDNFSENVFVPLLALCGALCARRRSLWWTLVCAQLLMGLKEDRDPLRAVVRGGVCDLVGPADRGGARDARGR